jgi:hypothetical protein
MPKTALKYSLSSPSQLFTLDIIFFLNAACSSGIDGYKKPGLIKTGFFIFRLRPVELF